MSSLFYVWVWSVVSRVVVIRSGVFGGFLRGQFIVVQGLDWDQDVMARVMCAQFKGGGQVGVTQLVSWLIWVNKEINEMDGLDVVV